MTGPPPPGKINQFAKYHGISRSTLKNRAVFSAGPTPGHTAMCKFITKLAWIAIMPSLVFPLTEGAAEEVVHIYNWNDYFAEDTLSGFQERTGVRAVLDLYDSNEILDAKLLAGSSGYDLVFPTARPFAGRQIRAGIYQPLDKSKLPGLKNLDPEILKPLQDIDPGNQYLVPYMWGTTGLASTSTRSRRHWARFPIRAGPWYLIRKRPRNWLVAA
jgi:hypothetical protein